MEVRVTFTYLNRSFQTKCKENDGMDEMFEKFVKELNDGSEKEHYIYYYENNKLGHESTIKNNKYLSHKNELNISVQKKLRIIKCPKCKCNDCIINLNNYIASFYGCKNNHSDSQVYDQYINSQKIDSDEIRCNEPNCQNTQQNYSNGFYKCLDCTELTGHSKYYCKDHYDQHDKEGHKIVKYDKKNYFCEKHFNEFTKYCFTDNQNLCEKCENEHKNHKIAKYHDMISNKEKEKLKESLKIMEKNVSNLKTIIDDIKYRLDGTLRIFKRYLYIANDIIGKYELFNKELKNHRILKSLWNLKFSNNSMNDNLTKIIKEKNLIQKVNKIIDIYEQKEKNYKDNKNEIFDYKKGDNEWWEEINKEGEKEKEKVNERIGEKQLKKNKTKNPKK